MVDYQNLYQTVKERLQKGQRPQLRLSREEFASLALILENALDRPESSQQITTQILCILDHCQTLSSLFENHLLRLLRHPGQSPELIIFTLAAFQKHVVTLRHRQGERIPGTFMEVLRQLLFHPHAEVQEWVVRTIEGLGGQAIIFRQDLQKIRPGLMAFLSPHRQATKEIIQGLENKWRPPQKS